MEDLIPIPYDEYARLVGALEEKVRKLMAPDCLTIIGFVPYLLTVPSLF